MTVRTDLALPRFDQARVVVPVRAWVPATGLGRRARFCTTVSSGSPTVSVGRWLLAEV